MERGMRIELVTGFFIHKEFHTAHRVQMERFNLKKLNEVEGKEQYCIEISNWFSALENLNTEVDINSAWES
jgi:hypothetical protein